MGQDKFDRPSRYPSGNAADDAETPDTVDPSERRRSVAAPVSYRPKGWAGASGGYVGVATELPADGQGDKRNARRIKRATKPNSA